MAKSLKAWVMGKAGPAKQFYPNQTFTDPDLHMLKGLGHL